MPGQDRAPKLDFIAVDYYKRLTIPTQLVPPSPSQWHIFPAGFDEVLSREWKPGTVLDTHTHPFSVEALVVQGEMWLTCGDETRHLRPGDTFALGFEVPHAERYGAEGTGPSIYIHDPDGNEVELKGPAHTKGPPKEA